jgi:hypothetical protein
MSSISAAVSREANHASLPIAWTYNEQVMALTIARGYLRPLLENSRVVRFLSQNFREFLFEFQRIIEAANLE